MGLPVVKDESPIKTMLKAHVKMIDDEELSIEILKIIEKHDQLLKQISLGKQMKDFSDETDMKEKNKTVKSTELEDVNKSKNIIKVIEIDESCEEVKDINSNKIEVKPQAKPKSSAAFSFLGNNDKQKQLIDEYVNKNNQSNQVVKKDIEKTPEKSKGTVY